MVYLSGQRIGKTVITHIHHKINVPPSNGFSDNSFGFPRAKAGNFCVDKIGVLFIAIKYNIIFKDMPVFMAPFNDIIIHPPPPVFAAIQTDDPKGAYGYVFKDTFVTA
jgi:hypothetical protein